LRCRFRLFVPTSQPAPPARDQYLMVARHRKEFTEANVKQHTQLRHITRRVAALNQNVVILAADLLDRDVVFIVAWSRPRCEKQHVATSHDVRPPMTDLTVGRILPSHL